VLGWRSASGVRMSVQNELLGDEPEGFCNGLNLDLISETVLAFLHGDRGCTRENVIFSNSLWTNSEYPNLLKNMFIWSL